MAVTWASLVGVEGHVGFRGRDGNWTMVRNQVHPVASLQVSLGTSTHLSAPFQQCHAKHPLQGPVEFVGPVLSIVRPLFSEARGFHAHPSLVLCPSGPHHLATPASQSVVLRLQ